VDEWGSKKIVSFFCVKVIFFKKTGSPRGVKPVLTQVWGSGAVDGGRPHMGPTKPL